MCATRQFEEGRPIHWSADPEDYSTSTALSGAARALPYLDAWPARCLHLLVKRQVAHSAPLANTRVLQGQLRAQCVQLEALQQPLRALTAVLARSITTRTQPLRAVIAPRARTTICQLLWRAVSVLRALTLQQLPPFQSRLASTAELARSITTRIQPLRAVIAPRARTTICQLL
jgi:hypothetical protein